MANFWKVNQTSTNGAVRYWDMIETMLAAGWTMPNAGDGTTMAANQVTHGNSGAGGLGNTNAWVRLQDPAGGREVTLQRSTTNIVFTMKYSKASQFTGGAPSATVMPTAADETGIMSSCSVHTATNCVHHCWASSDSPYCFYCVAYPVGGGQLEHLTIMDEVINSGLGVDPDPVYFLRCGAGTGSNLNYLAGTVGALNSNNFVLVGWGSSSAEAMNLYCLMGTANMGLFGYQAYDIPPGFDLLEDNMSSGLILRRNVYSPAWVKGFTTNFLLLSRTRYTSDTYTVSSPRDKISIAGRGYGGFALPWNGDVPIT